MTLTVMLLKIATNNDQKQFHTAKLSTWRTIPVMAMTATA
jgi:hypothetical protein